MIVRHRSRAGYTMLEMMIVLSLLSVVMMGVVTTTDRGLEALHSSTASTDVTARSGRTIARIVRELVTSDRSNVALTPAFPAASDTADFREGLDWVADAIVWGPPRRIAFEYAAGEADNGIDDNGNGLVDEGVVVLIDDFGGAAQRRVVLVNGVSEFAEGEQPNGADDNLNGLTDERGLSFEDNAGRLTIRLTIERIGPEGTLLQRTQEATIMPRNAQ